MFTAYIAWSLINGHAVLAGFLLTVGIASYWEFS